MFPNLMHEIETGENKVPVDHVENEPAEAESAAEIMEEEMETAEAAEAELEQQGEPDKFRHYCPDVVDFLRRCNTNKEAEEIITYLQKRGELTEEKACELKTQLHKDGVRSFGPKKEEDYYFKQSGLC